jgi:hypothetical protein
MSGHTPGPWMFRRAKERPRFIIEGLSSTGSGVWFLADVEGRSIDTNEANARLIAAAPELLAALKDLVEFEDRDDRLRDAARAAIAKAEGR